MTERTCREESKMNGRADLLGEKKNERQSRRERSEMDSIYDNERFFNEYAQMSRSREGLAGAGEWHQLRKMFPDLNRRKVLDLGCGYGWHCKYAVDVFCQVLFPEKSVGIPFFQQGIFPAFSGHYASLRMRACSIR